MTREHVNLSCPQASLLCRSQFEFDVREVVGLLLCVSTGAELQTVYSQPRFLTRRRIARATSEKARNTAALEAGRGAGR